MIGIIQNNPLLKKWNQRSHTIDEWENIMAKDKGRMGDAEYQYVLSRIRLYKKHRDTATVEFTILLARKYLHKRKYRLALKTIEKAYRKEPSNSELLWVYGRCLEETNNDRKAIAVYKKILKKGALRIQNEPCRHSKKWADNLLNDCRIAIGLCYAVCLQDKLAMRWITLHLKYRKPGMESIYSKKWVLKFVKDFLDK